MKPVNFIEVKKENKDTKNIVFLLLPLCLVVGFIVFDVFVNVSNKNDNLAELVSLEEANVLEEKIQSLNVENQENSKKIEFYNELDEKKALDKDLLKSLEAFSAHSNDNIFINSFSSNAEDIRITGISLSSDLLDDLDQRIKKDLNNFVLDEVNFEDGYYKFFYKGELKWNFLWT